MDEWWNCTQEAIRGRAPLLFFEVVFVCLFVCLLYHVISSPYGEPLKIENIIICGSKEHSTLLPCNISWELTAGKY